MKETSRWKLCKKIENFDFVFLTVEAEQCFSKIEIDQELFTKHNGISKTEQLAIIIHSKPLGTQN